VKRLKIFASLLAFVPRAFVTKTNAILWSLVRLSRPRYVTPGTRARVRLLVALFVAALAINFPSSGPQVLSQADEGLQIKEEDRPPKLNQPTDACASVSPAAAPDATVIAPFEPIPPQTEVAAPVGPAGGTLTSKDGAVEISVPKGAVSEDSILTFAGEAVESTRQAYTVYQFSVALSRQKDGLALDSLNLPATYSLQVPQNAADAFGSQFSNLALLRFNDQGNYWFKTDSSVDPPAKLITSASTALGRYQLAADPKLTTSANESIVYPIEGGNFTDKSG